jgi:hypothetical protein
MKKEDLEELKKLVGRKVVDIKATGDDCYCFDIIFDDGSALELYDLKCPKLENECYEKEIEVTVLNLLTGREEREKIKCSKLVGGGLFFAISSKETQNEKEV